MMAKCQVSNIVFEVPDASLKTHEDACRRELPKSLAYIPATYLVSDSFLLLKLDTDSCMQG